MSDESPVFDRAANELESLSRMSRLEARGTLRLALKDAGLIPKTVNAKSMLVVLDRILPALLTRRGVQGAPEMCRTISTMVRGLTGEGSYEIDTPEKIFARISQPARISTSEMKPPSSRPPPPSSSKSAPHSMPISPSAKLPSSPGWSIFSKPRGIKPSESDE
ncbi:MAG TPA: hypothetical protein PK156_48240 [Polyangium sp.]|nr:hypothetical protein [Polyangium sp.]